MPSCVALAAQALDKFSMVLFCGLTLRYHKTAHSKFAANGGVKLPTSPRKVSEDSYELFSVFRELYEQGYIEAAEHSNLDGSTYFDPRITLPGRSFFAKLKAPVKSAPHAINIGTISSSTFQVGNGNLLNINISVQELVEKIAKSSDSEAKSKLKELLNNGTVANLIGVGATTLIALLQNA